MSNEGCTCGAPWRSRAEWRGSVSVLHCQRGHPAHPNRSGATGAGLIIDEGDGNLIDHSRVLTLAERRCIRIPARMFRPFTEEELAAIESFLLLLPDPYEPWRQDPRVEVQKGREVLENYRRLEAFLKGICLAGDGKK